MSMLSDIACNNYAIVIAGDITDQHSAHEIMEFAFLLNLFDVLDLTAGK